MEQQTEQPVDRGQDAVQAAAVGQQGRTEPGHERHREAQAYILHHHGEEGSRQRGAEQGGEERGHAADRGRAAVMVREMEQLCNIVADAAAHLQGRALPAGGAAAQVGEHRAKEDGGHQQRADGLAALHGPDDIVGANALALGSFIKGYDGKARRGQQPEQPAVGTPQLGDIKYTSSLVRSLPFHCSIPQTRCQETTRPPLPLCGKERGLPLWIQKKEKGEKRRTFMSRPKGGTAVEWGQGGHSTSCRAAKSSSPVRIFTTRVTL